MRLHPQCIQRGALALSVLVLTLTTQGLLAGPTEYTVTRSFDGDETACVDSTTTVSLTGVGPGDGADLLTIVENFDAGLDSSNLVVTDISNPGVLADAFPPTPGIFEGRLVIAEEEPLGTASNTIHGGGNSYTSLSDTGRDIWVTGDTFEYAYTLLDGDFDVSVRIDDYEHETNVGCWGKYGIMARRSLDPTSRMISVQNHGPNGQPGGAPYEEPIPGGCTLSLGGQSTSIVARRNHLGSGRESAEMFEAIFGEDGVNPEGKPADYTHFEYLRLTRRGDLFEGWGAEAEDVALVEANPTDDLNWTKLPIGVWEVGEDEDFKPKLTDDPWSACWYVGFGNSEHSNDAHNAAGPELQTIEFEIINWTSDDSCFTPQLIGKTITWTDVPRSAVTAGLTYTLDAAPGSSPFNPIISGDVDAGASAVLGPDTVELFEVSPVGSLTMRNLGQGFGTATVDGSIFEMTGGGENIWHTGDHHNFMYQAVTGDFDATAFVTRFDVSAGGDFAKYGLMARQTCHFDSLADFVLARTVEGPVGGPRFAYRAGHRNIAGWTEPFQVDLHEVPGEVDPLNPDFYRLIRTGSQITSYVAWEDPNNLGQPFHWCVVGSLNTPIRNDELFVGMAVGSHHAATVNEVDFTLDISPYAPAPLGDLPEGAAIFERDFNSEVNGVPPDGAFWGTRFGNEDPGPFNPVVVDGRLAVVMDGRLRITDEAAADSASAVWFVNDALDNILETGFVAEYDVFATRAGLPDTEPTPDVTPGEGGMFVVAASASDQFSDVCLGASGTIIEELPDETLGAFVGTDAGADLGIPSHSVVDRGDLGDPSDDVYSSRGASGGEIGVSDAEAMCDDFLFDYAEVTGDFDIAIEITNQSHELNAGRWGKQGIMAREELTRDARFVMVHDTLPHPDGEDGTMVTARQSTVDCGLGSVSQQTFTVEDRFLRLTRRGDTLQGFASDDEELVIDLNPHHDCNWTAGPAITLPDLAETLFVGIANGEDFRDGVVYQIMDYRILAPDPTGEVNLGNAFANEYVGISNQMGFGGGGENVTGGPLARYECRPMLGVEVDTEVTAGNVNEGVGAPDNVGQYHIGLNTGASTQSRQTNAQFGVDFDELPDLFDGGVHIKLEYRPNGAVQVFASAPNGGGGAGDSGDPVKVIDTYVAPLNLGAGLADPVVGFMGSTSLGGTQTLEFDNLSIRALGGGGFKRGDGDASGTLNINDPIFNLIFQFLGGVTPVCKDALDTDDSGTVTINDPIISLTFQFLGGVTIPLPGPDECGPDPTMDNEECEAYPQEKCQ